MKNPKDWRDDNQKSTYSGFEVDGTIPKFGGLDGHLYNILGFVPSTLNTTIIMPVPHPMSGSFHQSL